jgi:CHASE3 domain sensor protein
VFFTTFAVAFMLADYLGTFEGFAIVSGFYLLVGIVLFWKRNDLIARIEKEIKQVIKHKKK